MDFKELQDFIENKIEGRAQQNYQFVMLRCLLLAREVKRDTIAKELYNYNQEEYTDYRYVEVYDVLTEPEKNLVETDGEHYYLIGYDSLSDTERYQLVSLCDEKIKWQREKKGYGKEPKNHNLTLKQATLKILKEENQPVHYAKICDNILLNHYSVTEGKTPDETVRRDIDEDIKHNTNSLFKKTGAGVFTLNFDNFKFTVLSDEKEIEQAQKTFLDTLNNFTTKKGKITIGFPGPEEKVNDDVNYNAEAGFWWYSKKLEDAANPRYWNCFALGEPTWKKNNGIVVEINPLVRGINRSVNGAFVKDQDEDVYITHSGVIGGGNTPGGFYDVYPIQDRWILANDGKNEPRDLILISQVSSPKLSQLVADYVKEVAKYKSGEYTAPYYLLLRHKSEDNPYGDDPSGKVYHYPKIANYTKVVPGAKTIWFDRTNGNYYFWGYGTISSIKERPDGEFEALFNDYKFFEKKPDSLEIRGKYLKKCTTSTQEKIMKHPGWNIQNSILEINKEIYNEITATNYLISDEIFDVGHRLFKIEMSQQRYHLPFENFNHLDLLENEINYKIKALNESIRVLSLDKWDEWKSTPEKICDAVRDAVADRISTRLVWAPPFHTEKGFFDLVQKTKSELGLQLYDFFKIGSSDPENFGNNFNNLISFLQTINRVDWRLLAYLAFLRDPNRYFPIHPSNFDDLLEFYGLSNMKEKTWQKYFLYVKLANELKSRLLQIIPEKDLSAIQIQSYMWVIGRAVSKKYWVIRAGEDGSDWENQKRLGIIGIHYYTMDLNEFIRQDKNLSKPKIIEEMQKIDVSKNRERTTMQHGLAYEQLEKFFSIREDDKIIAIGNNTTLLGIGNVLTKYRYRTDVGENCHTVSVDWYDANQRIVPSQQFNKTIKQITPKDYVDLMMPGQIATSTSEYSEFFRLLEKKNQFILYGPPGTGKTFIADKIAKSFVSKNKQLDSTKDQFSTPDKYKDYVSEKIKTYLVSKGFEAIQGKNANRFTFKKTGKTINIYFYFSGGTKINPDQVWIGLKDSTVEFLEEVPIENRFLVIVNTSSNNFVVLPYDIEQKYAKFKTIQGWDNTGGKAHQFTIEISNKYAKLRTREGSYDEKYYDCTDLMNNIGILDGSDDYKIESKQYVQRVTFHPSYSYEEFVEGIKPKTDDGIIEYSIEDGIFKKICTDATNDPENNYILLIDEINRGNIPKIFGELITLIEKDKRGSHSLYLTYSQKPFTVPKNLYIIGTMNMADRSLVHIDAALRRRFAFYETFPDYSIFEKIKPIDGINISKLLQAINQKLINSEMRDKQIGHSYFMNDGKSIESIDDLQYVFAYEILPLLREHFYDDIKGLSEILGGLIDSKGYVTTGWKDNPEEFKKIIRDTYPEVFE